MLTGKEQAISRAGSLTATRWLLNGSMQLAALQWIVAVIRRRLLALTFALGYAYPGLDSGPSVIETATLKQREAACHVKDPAMTEC